MIMIGLGGLLLFAVPVLDLWAGLEKSKLRYETELALFIPAEALHAGRLKKTLET